MGRSSANRQHQWMRKRFVSAKAASILRYPVVTVSLERARPITVAIAGEVTSPGTYTLRPGDGTTAGTIPSLTETLKLAQGVTQSAERWPLLPVFLLEGMR